MSGNPIRKYGWKKDREDERDLVHNFEVAHVDQMVTSVDLRDKMPAVYDQGQLGSCTANAIAGAYEYDEMKQNEPHVFAPSRLFIYYNERRMEGDVAEDNGAAIRDGIVSIATVGVCPETLWPYDVNQFAVAPPQACYTAALDHKSVQYKRVIQNLAQMKACLASGFPFVFGVSVYESFETEAVARTGAVPMPHANEQCLGGHAIMCVGFNDATQTFIFRNSWGTDWGMSGYGTMPYAYLTNPRLASDFWTVTRTHDV